MNPEEPKPLRDLPDMQTLTALCKRRGFVFQSSEIYGGLNSCWDYGPLGIEIKRAVKDAWWNAMIMGREDVEGLDAAILMHPRVWEASGHVENFNDPLVDCKKCKARHRADNLGPIAEIEKKTGNLPSLEEMGKLIEGMACPNCGTKGELTVPRLFNMMFRTHMGPIADDANLVYLRPETAQGIFVNFLNVQQSCRRKLPFGIAQIGKSFRNEITPGNFTFRTREFEQMEMQYFVKPGTDEAAFEEWKAARLEWHKSLGLRPDKLRWHQHGPNELAHYAKAAFDVQYEFPFGWKEIEGVHNRTDFDLSRHQEFSGKNLHYVDDAEKTKFIPYVIETAVGCDRTVLAVLADAAEKIYRDLRKHFRCDYDDAGSIGKRYRRQEEIGTPYCVTIDFDTLQDQAVTVRHRDTMAQDRIAISQLKDYIDKGFATWKA